MKQILTIFFLLAIPQTALSDPFQVPPDNLGEPFFNSTTNPVNQGENFQSSAIGPVDPFNPTQTIPLAGEERDRIGREGAERQESTVMEIPVDPFDPDASELEVVVTGTEGSPVVEPRESIVYESFTRFPGLGQIGTLCQLTQGLWNLGFIVLFVSAFAALVYGAFLYTSAGVNAGKVNQAKEVIGNAVIGLVIGLSVVIVIQVINPGLLTTTCEIQDIQRVGDASFSGERPGGVSREELQQGLQAPGVVGAIRRTVYRVVRPVLDQNQQIPDEDISP